MSSHTTTQLDLEKMASQYRKAIEENTRKLKAAELMIAEVKDLIEINALGGHRHPGSFTNAVISAIHKMLFTNGPMHRKDILAELEAQDLRFMGKGESLRQLAGYLNKAENAQSLGGGIWELIDTPRNPYIRVESA